MFLLEDTTQLTPREKPVTTMPTLLLPVRRTRLPKSPSRSACSPSQSHIRLHRQPRVPLLKCRIPLPPSVQLLPQCQFSVPVLRRLSRFLLRYRLLCLRPVSRASTSGIRESG